MDRTSIRLMIVDDSPDDRDQWCRLLSSVSDKAYSFKEAETGDEGLNALESEIPDCILLDYNLPDLTGIEFLIEMSKMSDGDINVPVVMLTGQGGELVAAKVLKLGAQDYLIKDNITDTALDRAISNAIEKVDLNRKINEKQSELQSFAFTVAHDLKAPLNRVSTYCGLLHNSLADKLSDKESKNIELIQTDIQFTIKLINDLLDYAKHTPRSEKELVEIDLNIILKRVKDNLEINIKESNAIIDIPHLPGVKGCEVSLIQLFQNLIANAIKFNESKEPEVIVSSNVTNHDNLIYISDNGIGINSEYLETIFMPFKRLNSKSKYPGSGIGLATCKAIITQHKGKIWAESKEGEGTTFAISFPVI